MHTFFHHLIRKCKHTSAYVRRYATALALNDLELGMQLELRQVLQHLKRALRIEPQLPAEEESQLLELSAAIIDFGRLTQAYFRYPGPEVIVEIEELANRFRETPQTVKDALLRLEHIGRAEPTDRRGTWKLQLAGALPNDGREFQPVAPQSATLDDSDGDAETA
jgi:hypothetical protein